MRLIDADALIKAIDGNPFTTDSVKSYIRVSVAKIPTIETPHWIPCSERLPEEGQEVLASVNDGGRYVDVDQYKWGGFMEYETDVIAWMPLPESYQEVKHD